MALEEMPDSDAELAGHGHGGFVAAAAGGHGEV